MEAVLTTMWSDVLSIPQEIGRTSLTATEIMNGIHTQTEVHRPMRVPFEGPMINQMAASLVAQQAVGLECVPSQTDGIPHRWVVGPTATVLGDRWQSVKWHAESAKHHRVQAAGGIEMWADDVLLHLHQVGTQLDIFAKSQASACTNKRSVLKKEMASVSLDGAPRKHGPRAGVVGAQEARARLPRGLLCDTPCRFARLPGVSPPIGL